jgi:hypothetical protein
MKRLRIPGLFDVLKVDRAAAIRQLATDRGMDRAFLQRRPLLNGWLIGKALRILSSGGKQFPTMRAIDADGRAQGQAALWERLNVLAPHFRTGPDELGALAHWVAGSGDDEVLGLLLQRLIGRLFNRDFVATAETWNAAMIVGGSLGDGQTLRKLWWRIGGRLDKAKALMSSQFDGDLAGVHATTVAIHNMVKGLRDMRVLFAASAQAGVPDADGTKAMIRHCLHAPKVVLRQAGQAGSVDGCPYAPSTLILLELESAYRREGDVSMVFLDQAWSRCPAEQWVPAVLEGVWIRGRAEQPRSTAG